MEVFFTLLENSSHKAKERQWRSQEFATGGA